MLERTSWPWKGLVSLIVYAMVKKGLPRRFLHVHVPLFAVVRKVTF